MAIVRLLDTTLGLPVYASVSRNQLTCALENIDAKCRYSKSPTSTLLDVPGTEHIIRITNVIDIGIALNRGRGCIISV